MPPYRSILFTDTLVLALVQPVNDGRVVMYPLIMTWTGFMFV